MSSAASRVAIIFGAGSNVGAALVKGFVGAGYRVATVSRSRPTTTTTTGGASSNPFNIQADLSDPAAPPAVLEQLAQAGWAFPSVVVWNAAALTPPDASDPANPFAIAEADFDRDMAVMSRSPYRAAGEAVKVWREREGDAATGRRGTFIMTGNMTPSRIFSPALTTLGAGKSAANYWVGTADAAFKEQGIRFFFADERSPGGGPVSKTNGESHAKMYLDLVEGKEDLPYYVTFMDGKPHKF